MDSKQIFSKNVQHYMKIKGIERKDLCEALGYKYPTVSDWIKGSKFPRMDKVYQIADYLEVDIEDLLYEHKLPPVVNSDIFDALQNVKTILSDETTEAKYKGKALDEKTRQLIISVLDNVETIAKINL